MDDAPDCTGCGGRDWLRLVVQEGHGWFRCVRCGMLRLIPMPPAGAARAAIAGGAIGGAYIEGYRRKLASKMRRSENRVRRLARRMAGPRLLDVGSNIGCLVEAGRRLGLDGVGVEINATLVEFARRTFPACRFIAASIEDAGLGAGAFDGVYCSEVIEHVPDQDCFVAEIARVLRGGGVLYLTTPGAHQYVDRAGAARAVDFGAPDHKFYHSRASLAALLGRHGFADIRFAFNFGRGHKLFSVKRPA